MTFSIAPNITADTVLSLITAYLPNDGEYSVSTTAWTKAIIAMKEEILKEQWDRLFNDFQIGLGVRGYSGEVSSWLLDLYARRSEGGPISHRLGSRCWLTMGSRFQTELQDRNETKVPLDILALIKTVAEKMAPLLTVAVED